MRAAATGVARLLASRGERYAERRVDGVEGPRPPPRRRAEGAGPEGRKGRRKTNLVVDQHVARLAVPVDDAVRVQERQSDDQFRERRHTRVKRHLPPFEQRLERPAREVVRDQVEGILGLEGVPQVDHEGTALRLQESKYKGFGFRIGRLPPIFFPGLLLLADLHGEQAALVGGLPFSR